MGKNTEFIDNIFFLIWDTTLHRQNFLVLGAKNIGTWFLPSHAVVIVLSENYLHILGYKIGLQTSVHISPLFDFEFFFIQFFLGC